MSQVEAVPWPLQDNPEYDVFLSAPFPPIEIIRWRPKIREEDGRTCVDEDGRKMLGEACWFTFDNRRLYCLQAAAAKQWPRRAAAIVHIMHDLPLSRCTPRKFRTTDLGCSVRISRRHDVAPRATWSWAEATHAGDDESQLPETGKKAMNGVHADAAKEDWSELLDVPEDMAQRSSELERLEPANPEAVTKGTITNGNGSLLRGPEAEPTHGTSRGHAASWQAPSSRHAASSASKSAAWSAPAAQASASSAGLNGMNGFGGFNGFRGASCSSGMTVSALAAQFEQQQASAGAAGLNGFTGPGGFGGAGGSSSAMTVSALATQLAQSQALQDQAALTSGKANGSLLGPGMTPAMALAMTSLLPPQAQAAESCNNGGSLFGGESQLPSSSTGPLLSGPQLLPVSAAEDDDDEENCVQS